MTDFKMYGLSIIMVLFGCSPSIDSLLRLDSGTKDDCIDSDGDGFCEEIDCNDSDYSINPDVIESCNGVDDNCNTHIDEETISGSECLLKRNGCEFSGIHYCNFNGSIICDAEASIPDEICDGIDNDCDGEIDEGNPGGGEECDTGDPGICNIGEWTCVTNAESTGFGCIPNITPGTQAEICDGVDNDCDGSIDEDADGNPIATSCYTGPEGTSGEGLCSDGIWTCSEGRFGPCIGQIRPTDEICNGNDDDCDGIADEGMPEECACDPNANPDPVYCYTGPAETDGVGLCNGGDAMCNDTTNLWEECAGEILPTDELCDTFDNDCDGIADEGLGLGDSCTVGIGQCQNTGVVECAADHGVRCNAIEHASSDEVCDGIDNDCDGIIDDIPTINTDCSMGTGTCETTGIYVCNLENNTIVCNAPPPNSSEEVCDEIDNDCDGDIDEGFNVGESCTVGIGACERTGIFACSFDTTVVCNIQPGGPGAEICDGIDNDCDGEVDEGFGVGNLCVGIGECSDGQLECNLVGEAICNTNPGGSAYVEEDDVCDGLDNNCNGNIDEYYYSLGQSCNESCNEGAYECHPTNQNNTICSTSPSGSEVLQEICDGIDNDCDWQIDEQEDLVAPLADDQLGVCSGSHKDCSGLSGWTEPNYIAFVDMYETVEVSCDGQDNDCDGTVDEDTDFPEILADNQNGVCAGIEKVCSGGGWQEPDYAGTIGATYEATEILCDTLDNDCDGAVDEGCP